MVLSGPPTPVGGAQPVNPSLLRSNSGLLGGAQPNPALSQQPYSSLVSPRTQFNGGNNSNNSMNLIGNISNPSSLVNHSIGNGANPDSLAFATSGEHSQPQQIETVHNFQQQQNFSVAQQQQIGGGLGPVKLEPQMGPSDQNGGPGPSSQQLNALRGAGAVKIEPQQLPPGRGLGPVKSEQQHLDSSMFLQQQQQQQQQLLQISRQNPQNLVQMNLLQQQQRLIQLQQQQQQQQQQQLLKGLPPRAQLQQQHQQIQQNLPSRTQLKTNSYEPGVCARRLTQYMYHQQLRPQDNNIEFWRKFVAEFFAPNAKKRWCVSLYGSGRQTTGVFPQDVWHCEICNRKPGRGFETTAEVLPRLCQIKYASGTLEELLYVDMPRESHNAIGQTVLNYPKAIQESVFEQLRVVRDGHLRIAFNSDLKISSWEFCARKHEELIPRRLIIPQISQLGTVVQKYQNVVQNSSSTLPTQDLQNNCNAFVASARQLAKALEVPLVNDLGYTKRYVRCLQISEVVNSMKDLIDYSRDTGTGPMESLINFPRRNSTSSGLHPQQAQQAQQAEEQHQPHVQSPMNSCPNGVVSVNNSVNSPSSTPPSTTTIASILRHQNSMNSRQEGGQMSSTNTAPYGGGPQMPSTSSTNSLPQSQPNPSSPFSPPTPSTSNNMIPTSRNPTTHLNSATSPANMPDPSESQSSVQQIIQEMMMSSSPLNEIKGMNGNSGSNGGMGFQSMGGGPMATVGGLRAAMVNNGLGMNGRVGVGMNNNNHMSPNVMTMNHHHRQQQQDIMGSQLRGGVGSVNNFNNFHFDWKPSA